MTPLFIDNFTSVVTVPELILSSLVSNSETSDAIQVIDWGDETHQRVLCFKKNNNYMPGRNSAHQAPVIIYDDGLPVWPLTRYLYASLDKKQFSATLPFSTANETAKAKALSFYANWCMEERIDLLNFDFFMDEDKPVHKFHKYLLTSIYAEGSPLTHGKASFTIATVISFYRWAKTNGYINKHASMWHDEHQTLHLKGIDGRSYSKDITQSELSIKSIKKSKYALPSPDRLTDDGEQLRPLDENEEYILMNALKEIDNYQYSLIFIIALVTGMRKQPILTLREESIELLVNQIKNGSTEALLTIGGRGLVNNKKQKNCTVYFPKDLVLALSNFKDGSDRKSRVKKAENNGFFFENPQHQHLFITQQGMPMYTGWDNPLRANGEIKGGALNTFIQKNLKHRLKALGFMQRFIFHDLRATFAHNFLQANYDPEKQDRSTRNNILNVLKSRMGHNSIEMTEHYLNVAGAYDGVKLVTKTYEALLRIE